PVTTYYGATVPAQGGVNPTAVGPVDPFFTAFVQTDDSNNPLTQVGSAIYIRQDSRFALAYAITDNLTISLPVHVMSFEQGGEYAQNQKITLEPGVDVNIAKAGNLSNINFKYGYIDNMTSSRAGLAFRAPIGYNGILPWELPVQPAQKGVSIRGTVSEGAFGLTDFEASFTRVENTVLDTIVTATDPASIVSQPGPVGYLLPVLAPNAGYVQSGAAGALTSNTFTSGSGTLQQVYLTQKAVAGSVYISYYNGATYNNAGVQTGGPAIALPGLTYNEAYNAVVFGAPLPAGSTVVITYRGLTVNSATSFERYMIHMRANQKFKGVEGLEIGLNFNRIFDFADVQTTGTGPTGFTFVNRNSPEGYGLVSDTVLGLDFQATIPYELSGPGSKPVIFGEISSSKFTPDFANVSAVGDTAGLIGIRTKLNKIELSAQYQSVGVDFLDGAPFRYYGNAPTLFAFYKLPYLPDFFGFANNLGINQQFDKQFTDLGLTSPKTAGNPNLTFAYPAFNPFKAQGPTFFSSFAPNTQGITINVTSPVRVGDFNFTARGGYSHLQEIRPNSFGGLLYGPAAASSVPEQFSTYTAGVAFALPVFGTKANVNLNGSYERLTRLDSTAFTYYPANPATQQFDGPSVAQAVGQLGGSAVSFYPNHVNMRHITLAATGALPLTKDVTLNGSYSTQRFGGEFGTTLTQNISERKDLYSGGVTYSIPKTNSSLTFSAKRYSYQDDVLPTYNFGQNRQDVNFTVRF
ncbi:MAG: hypothetical protein M3N13_03270, partial [Candidatus Eremiobacteraeota bacterium]|nr:hypothetical protein [Candidatus Eremiobacteraeota bacterium]